MFDHITYYLFPIFAFMIAQEIFNNFLKTNSCIFFFCIDRSNEVFVY